MLDNNDNIDCHVSNVPSMEYDHLANDSSINA